MKIETREVHVGGLGDFDVALRALDDVHFVAEAFHESCFVGGVYAIGFSIGEGLLEKMGFEDLGSLREHDTFPGNSGGDEGNIFGQTGAFHFFHRIHRGDGEDGCLAATRFFDDAGNLLDGDEGAHSIVDDDQFGVFGNEFEGVADGTLAGVGAFYDQDRLPELFLANASVEAIHDIRTGGDNDVGDQGTSGNALDGVDDDGHAVEFEELFWGLVTHARAETCSGKNRSDMTHR